MKDLKLLKANVQMIALMTALSGTLLSISACTTNVSDEPNMSAAEITSQIIGNKLGYSGAFSGDITYRTDGSIYYTANGNPYTGRWRLKGNQMCTVLNSDIRGGRESCFDWITTGKGQYKTSLGYRAWLR